VSAAAVTRDWPAALVTAARLVTFAVICAILYWGQIVLIPIALAALITFLLAPLVSRLDRLGSPRVLSVMLVVCIAAGALGGIGYVVVGELGELASELPAHRQNIRSKVNDLRNFMRGGALEDVQSTIEEISDQVGEPAAAPPAAPARTAATDRGAELRAAADPARGDPAPIPVQIVAERRLLGDAETWTPALDAAATFGLTMLLAIFMLIWREDLRNRLVSLAGATSIVVTTKAIVEAGQRISRYLQMQFLINASMGVAVGVGLFFIGVPYAPLWGLAAAIFRYIPYVGPWIAALLPITVSLITAPNWEQVALVLALFAVLELLSNNFMEPWLYGQSVGLSALAVIVSAVFWTWLWGSVGLVLATPLTVCLVVLARYIPALAIFDRLLSDRPVLESHLLLYQRLLSHDEDGAEDIVERHLAEHSLTETCEELLLGTLLALKRDIEAGRITADEGGFVVNGLREMVDDLPATADERSPRPEGSVALMGFPVRDALDEVALHILRALLRSERCEIQVLSAELLVGERIAMVEAQRPAAICMVSLPPGDLTALRQACKRLRLRHPSFELIVGRLGMPEAPARSTEVLLSAGANRVLTTLADVRDAARHAARNVPDAAAAKRFESSAAAEEAPVRGEPAEAPVAG
jgi:predicted PurR-regulated permease PerM